MRIVYSRVRVSTSFYFISIKDSSMVFTLFFFQTIFYINMHTLHGNCTDSEDKVDHRSSSGSDFVKDLLRWD